MSILIKGIDMPPTVNGVKLTHELYIRSDGRVFDDDLEEVGQAIQIPRPHGRLIDADKIMKDLEEWKLNPNNDDEAVVFVNHFQGIVRTEPTILEAEE